MRRLFTHYPVFSLLFVVLICLRLIWPAIQLYVFDWPSLNADQKILAHQTELAFWGVGGALCLVVTYVKDKWGGAQNDA